jgi:uncharacterized coiled-coil protein SlyX
VFENGQLIDDTSRKVSDSEREQLQQQAFLQASGDKKEAASQLQIAKRLQAEFGAPENSAEAATAQTPPPHAPPGQKPPEPANTPAAPAAAPNQPAVPSAEQMRALIQRWETLEEQNARRQAAIQAQPPASGP